MNPNDYTVRIQKTDEGVTLTQEDGQVTIEAPNAVEAIDGYRAAVSTFEKAAGIAEAFADMAKALGIDNIPEFKVPPATMVIRDGKTQITANDGSVSTGNLYPDQNTIQRDKIDPSTPRSSIEDLLSAIFEANPDDEDGDGDEDGDEEEGGEDEDDDRFPFSELRGVIAEYDSSVEQALLRGDPADRERALAYAVGELDNALGDLVDIHA